jgi:hypothetical protein
MMDYSLNKASEELLKKLCILKLRIHNYLMHSFDWATLVGMAQP